MTSRHLAWSVILLSGLVPVCALGQTVLLRGSIRLGSSGGEAAEVNSGNLLLVSSAEQEIRMARSGSAELPQNPEFRLGRIIPGGDGSPEFRVLYSDDLTRLEADPALQEFSVLEFDSKGIVASVKRELGSHFEGFLQGDSEPLFRLNSSPSMQLELGPGGVQATDVWLRRAAPNTLSILTGGTEQLRIDGGYIQLQTASGPPPAADCDEASEHGRLKVDSAAALLYLCVDVGWVAK